MKRKLLIVSLKSLTLLLISIAIGVAHHSMVEGFIAWILLYAGMSIEYFFELFSPTKKS